MMAQQQQHLEHLEQQQPLDLERFRVGGSALSSLFYVPAWISADEEARLLEHVHCSRAKWVQLSGRRLQNHGGVVHAKGLIPAPLPRWLEAGPVAKLAAQLPQLFGDGQSCPPANHVLINAYTPGCGIMPHQDGPLYHPAVAICSTGSPALLRFWRKQPEGGTGGQAVASVVVMPRSLLVFSGDAYEHCLHGIDEVSEEVLDASVVNLGALQEQQADRGNDTQAAAAATGVLPRTGERVSFTLRRVLKVHKALGLLGRR